MEKCSFHSVVAVVELVQCFWDVCRCTSSFFPLSLPLASTITLSRMLPALLRQLRSKGATCSTDKLVELMRVEEAVESLTSAESLDLLSALASSPAAVGSAKLISPIVLQAVANTIHLPATSHLRSSLVNEVNVLELDKNKKFQALVDSMHVFDRNRPTEPTDSAFDEAQPDLEKIRLGIKDACESFIANNNVNSQQIIAELPKLHGLSRNVHSRLVASKLSVKQIIDVVKLTHKGRWIGSMAMDLAKRWNIQRPFQLSELKVVTDLIGHPLTRKMLNESHHHHRQQQHLSVGAPSAFTMEIGDRNITSEDQFSMTLGVVCDNVLSEVCAELGCEKPGDAVEAPRLDDRRKTSSKFFLRPLRHGS